MWIHSVVSPYDIFADDPQTSYPHRSILIQGGIVDCLMNGNDFQINRLISTDPKLYLNPRYCPGSPFPGDFPS